MAIIKCFVTLLYLSKLIRHLLIPDRKIILDFSINRLRLNKSEVKSLIGCVITVGIGLH